MHLLRINAEIRTYAEAMVDLDGARRNVNVYGFHGGPIQIGLVVIFAGCLARSP